MGFRFNLLGGDLENSAQASIVLLSLFMVGGLLLAGYGFTRYQSQSESIDNAVNITATVTDTNIRTDSSRKGGIDYQAEITFGYSYEGEDYSSDFIYPLDDDREFNTESEAQDYLEDYPNGEDVAASVNPEKPSDAFLNAKRSDQPLLFMLIGGLMALLGSYKTTKRLI